MDIFQKLTGIIGNVFKLGVGSGAHAIANDTAGVKVTENDGSTLAALKSKRLDGSSDNNHAATFIDLKERAVYLTGGFDGGAPGTPADGYWICHTAGGSFDLGKIYLASGGTMGTTAVLNYQGQIVMTGASTIGGSLNLIANGVYVNTAGTTPTWVLKGDGFASWTSEGLVQTIKVPFTYSDIGTPVSSTATIPENAQVLRCVARIDTAFSGGSSPTLLVEVDGASSDTSLLLTTESNIEVSAQYQSFETFAINAAKAGPAKVTLGGTATAGAGMVLVDYVVPKA